MSYELLFRPRAGALDRKHVKNFFDLRMHYSVDDDDAWYRNEDTGTGFVLTMRAEAESVGALNFKIGDFLPSFIGEEASQELAAVVDALDLIVADSIEQDAQQRSFEPEKFLTDWHHRNELAYQSRVNEARSGPLFSLPRAELDRAWRWNIARDRRRTEHGARRFVPRVMFFAIEGIARSTALWPDAIPALLPRVDYLIIHRQVFAPRKFLLVKSDVAVVSWRQASLLIEAHSGGTDETGYLIAYDDPPREVGDFVKALTPYRTSLPGIATAAILDAEWVRKYATAPAQPLAPP